MSILDINSLLSTIPSYPVSPRPGAGGAPVQPPSVQSEPSDRFTRGQYWQNRAVSQGGGDAPVSADVYSRADIVPRVKVLEDNDGVGAARKSRLDEAAGAEHATAEDEAAKATASAEGATKPTGEPLSQSEMALVESLKKADLAVRAHEMAHLAAAGGLAKGGASYKLQKGPDGKSYAVGGEVQIDVSKGATPELTAQKMRAVRRAALAPVDPSPQDQKVAAQATLYIAEAAQELSRIRAQGPEVQKTGGSQEGENAQSPSAGEIYQDFGRTLINEPGGKRSAPVVRRNIADYGLSSAVSQNQSGLSPLNIIA